MKDLIVIGAGNLGRETTYIVDRINESNKEPIWQVKGFVDDVLFGKKEEVDGYKVLGPIDWLNDCEDEIYAICSLGLAADRKKVIGRIANSNVKWATLIDPDARAYRDAEVGEGSVICGGSILGINAKVKKHVVVNVNCTIGHDDIIDDYCVINPGANIAGNVLLDGCVDIGTGAQVIEKLTVGHNTTIGAGGVVVRNIQDNCVAVGCPARVMKNKPRVSVLCTAYNYERCLEKCLEGLVNQKTSFNYEVVVHDDASTDGTADIIRKYEQKYPDMVRAVYQSENQYSQGISIFRECLCPASCGEFIAICEGDDYWTDTDKLQMQYDFLMGHEDYSACVHNAVYHNLREGEEHLFPGIEADRDFDRGEIIAGGAQIFATNSIFCRREVLENMPECFNAREFEDYQMFIYASIRGKVRCFSKCMSAYNYGVDNSWTERVEWVPEKRIEHYEETIRMLRAVDDYYKQLFHDEIESTCMEVEQDMTYIRRTLLNE